MAASKGNGDSSPPPKKGSSANEARRAGETASRFNRALAKTKRARALRQPSTNVETRLWDRLRNKQLGVAFRRHYPAGPYFLDFYCSPLRLAIELDGGQHAPREQHDAARTRWLSQRGVTVIRFWNSDVTENLTGVLEVIAAQVSMLQSARNPHPALARRLPPFAGRIKPRSLRGVARCPS